MKLNTNLNNFSKIVLLTEKEIAKLWLIRLKSNLPRKVMEIIIEGGEKSKNLETCQQVWEKMLTLGIDRKSLLVNFGGGVICDLGGFVASVYLRGIKYINIPTTLLAMVDASIGGKTGINFGGVKNILGSFYDPLEIIIDVDFLKTLPERLLIEGFAEMIKHAVIEGKNYFDFVTSKRPTDFTQKELEEIIKKSIEIKLKIVSKDKKEDKGLRKVLNFGHTIGHALESLTLKTTNPLLHGEAVAIGMIAESYLAYLADYLPQKDFFKIEKVIANAKLPTKASNIPIEKILEMINFDKKNIGGKILFSLPKKIGRVDFDIEVSKELVIKAIDYIIL